jgi:HD-like signal output (HDOD) protein
MKRCIYLVDDQAPIVETAVLILRTIDPQWEITGFTDPFAALAAVRVKAPDLVLSDQAMPGMQGSQLLEAVRTISPTTIRVIMSGYVALNKLSLITSAHQYIAKPFNTTKLRELIRRSFAAQERISEKGLQAVATSLRSIPSLPQVYHSLLAQLENHRNAVSEIAQMVDQDAGLSIKVIQLANSPLFGQDRLITTPTEAVMCLGTDILAAVVLSQSLFRHYQSVAHAEMDLRKIWHHCWETAYFAQHICRAKGLESKTAEEALLAGLLHEIGRFVLIDNFPDRYQRACDEARQTKTPLPPCLLKVFKTTPFQITAYLLELWGLPEDVIAAISAQDDPAAAQPPGFSLVSALYIADHIACRKSPPDSFPAADWDAAYFQSIGCAEDIAAWEKLSLATPA